MDIVEIRNRFVVIDSDKMTKEVVEDVKRYNAECIKKNAYLYLEYLFTEKALEIFQEQLKDLCGDFSENFGFDKAMSPDCPVFNGCHTELVVKVEVYANYAGFDNKLYACKKNIQRCIEVNGKYYTVKKYQSDKSYRLQPGIYSKLYNTYYRQIELPVRPNLVGAMTPKKLKAWVDYWDEVDRLAEQKKEEIDTKVKEFKKKLKKIAPNKVDKRCGYIVKNGIKYSWNLDENGNANDQVELDFSLYKHDKVELFKMLSNNKFDPNKGLL